MVEPWDELRDAGGDPRPAATEVLAVVDALELDELRARQAAAAADILTMGITFTVYNDGRGIDRAWPFDVIPRVIEAGEWARIEPAWCSACVALNRFIDDLYNDQRIVADGVFPGDLLDDSTNFRAECRGVHPRFGVWAHISGSDLVRDSDGTMYVLEDNLRVPSGVSYVLENRAVAKRVVPRAVRPAEHRPGRLLHRGALQAARVARSRRRGPPERRRAHAGHLQLGLLRALVPRPADGRDAGRGQRPRRLRRRPGLHAHDRRPRAGRRDLPPDRRPVPRSRGVPAPTRRSACPG